MNIINENNVDKIKEKQFTKISKMLSLILRHAPETIWLQLDENGWIDVEELIKNINKTQKDINLDFSLLKEVVETNKKNRFSFSDDYKKIRANQWHSLSVDLWFESKIPPKILYHGTSDKKIESILQNWIQSNRRQYVHLTDDYEVARNVWMRHWKPIVLIIDTQTMIKDKIDFYLSENNVWLTKFVGKQYIEIER